MVRKSYFTKNESDTEFYNVYVFGIQSCSGRILTFHVMTDHGMLRSRVPISEIYTSEPTNDIPFNLKQLWDCHLEGTEVLTKNGFVDLSEVSFNDEICTINIEKDLIEYQKPTNIISKLYKGNVINFGGNTRQKLDIAVTETHNMLVDNYRLKTTYLKPAKDLVDAERIKLTSNWIGNSFPDFVFKHKEFVYTINEVDFAAFLGWYVSEGCTFIKDKRKTINISQSKNANPVKRLEVENLIDKIGFKTNKCESSISFFCDELYDYLFALGNCYTMRIPQWLKESKSKVINVFLNAAVKGDGWLDNDFLRRYASVSKGLADDVQELFMKVGSHANIRRRKAKPYCIEGRHGTNTKDQYYVVENKLKLGSHKGSKTQSYYEGMVYCVTVPNSTMVIRRNGKLSFTGNCFSENVSVIEYDFLAFHRAQIILRDGTKVWGTYMFTVDWYDNPYSDEPSDYKCGHIFEADEGYLLCQPNNRILWKDSNWVTKPLPENLKQFKVDTELESVENKSDRWITEDTDSFYYDIKEQDEI